MNKCDSELIPQSFTGSTGYKLDADLRVYKTRVGIEIEDQEDKARVIITSDTWPLVRRVIDKMVNS